MTTTDPEVYSGYVEWEGIKLPYVDVRCMWTSPERASFEWGFNADLPCENGAIFSMTFDPDYRDDEGLVTYWAYVRHPEHGGLIGASLRFGEVLYSSDCKGSACSGCEHDNSQWWGYAQSALDLQEKWTFIARLPVKPHAGRRKAG